MPPVDIIVIDMTRDDHEHPSTEPELVVQRQLDAYNARDLDTLLTIYAENAEMFEHPSKLLASALRSCGSVSACDLKSPICTHCSAAALSWAISWWTMKK